MKASKKMQTVIEAIAQVAGLDLTRVGAHLRIEHSPWMPLVIEVIAPHQVSVAHYGTQAGDAMRDPEMVFFTNTIDGAGWIPIYYLNDYAGVEREAATVRGGSIASVWIGEMADQARFAQTWATNIRQQGFIAAARRRPADAAQSA